MIVYNIIMFEVGNISQIRKILIFFLYQLMYVHNTYIILYIYKI